MRLDANGCRKQRAEFFLSRVNATRTPSTPKRRPINRERLKRERGRPSRAAGNIAPISIVAIIIIYDIVEMQRRANGNIPTRASSNFRKLSFPREIRGQSADDEANKLLSGLSQFSRRKKKFSVPGDAPGRGPWKHVHLSDTLPLLPPGSSSGAELKRGFVPRYRRPAATSMTDEISLFVRAEEGKRVSSSGKACHVGQVERGRERERWR